MNLRSWTFSKSLNNLAEAIALELNTLGGGYAVDQDVSLSIAGENKSFFIEDISRELTPQGWSQSLQGLSPIGKKLRASPARALQYMSQTPREKKDWERDYLGKESTLDFVPLRKNADDFGVGGWRASEIVDDLAARLGTPVHLSTPDYWVKEFSITPTTGYLDAILSLTNIFNPVASEEGGHIFIRDENDPMDIITGNTLVLNNSRLVRQEIRRKVKPQQIRLLGEQGQFYPEKYKGPIVFYPLTLINIPQVLGRPILSDELQMITTFFGDYKINTATTVAGNVRTIARQVMVKDIHGQDSYVVYEEKDTEILNSNWWGFATWSLISRHQILRIMDLIDYYWARPREQYVTEIQGRYVPIGGQMTWKSQAEISTKRFYYDDDRETFALQLSSTSGLVVWDGQSGFLKTPYRRLSDLRPEDVSSGSQVSLAEVEYDVRSFIKGSEDTYIEGVINYSLQEDRVNIDTDAQLVSGGGQMSSKKEPRRMQVYAETPQGDGSAPAQSFNLPSSSWESVEEVLPMLDRRFNNRGEVEYTFEVDSEINPPLGVPIQLGSYVSLDGSETLSPPSLASTPIVSGVQIKKELSGKVTTQLTVKARLA